MDRLTEALVTIFGAIIGVAVLSVIVSKNAQTPAVLTSFGQMFSNSLSAATAPVTGHAATPNVGGGGGFSSAFSNFAMPQL